MKVDIVMAKLLGLVSLQYLRWTKPPFNTAVLQKVRNAERMP